MPLPIVLFAGLIVGVGYLLVGDKKKKVFISYHAKSDARYKHLIKAWAENNKFKLEFDDVSTDVGINSRDKNYLRKRMKEQIEKSDVVIVFIGKDTHQRDWVKWEISKAKELNKPIIAVKEKRTHSSPKELLGCGVQWVYGFSEEKIRQALEA